MAVARLCQSTSPSAKFLASIFIMFVVKVFKFKQNTGFDFKLKFCYNGVNFRAYVAT